MAKVLKLLETESDVPNAPSLVISGGEEAFENVSFQHSENKKGLSNIPLAILKHKTIAIVGSTDSGKFMTLKPVLRSWDSTSGRILIDGQDIALTAQRRAREQSE
ncbi:Iron-sulfur clusters transporter atm1, mitochondrial [Haplosporangium sp. Z 767]|nr:Iron-sulfur clusters transporter atm1, mitochondrial [Haplosporangium sp. Z 767]KAF9183465.1 Iron-sulfur clusters transporter atm1, mitochondrial [Haplosporangium sp. Z 11]